MNIIFCVHCGLLFLPLFVIKQSNAQSVEGRMHNEQLGGSQTPQHCFGAYSHRVIVYCHTQYSAVSVILVIIKGSTVQHKQHTILNNLWYLYLRKEEFHGGIFSFPFPSFPFPFVLLILAWHNKDLTYFLWLQWALGWHPLFKCGVFLRKLSSSPSLGSRPERIILQGPDIAALCGEEKGMFAKQVTIKAWPNQTLSLL